MVTLRFIFIPLSLIDYHTALWQKSRCHIDSDLSVKPHIKKCCPVLLCASKNHHQIKAILSYSDLEKHTQALIFSRLDYCNSLLSLSHLQLVQNAASRLLSGCNRRYHITPIPITGSLYVLRIDLKILLITGLGLAPSYVIEMLTPYKPTCRLRSLGWDPSGRSKVRTLN